VQLEKVGDGVTGGRKNTSGAIRGGLKQVRIREKKKETNK
jgi:hypothetical protein